MLIFLVCTDPVCTDPVFTVPVLLCLEIFNNYIDESCKLMFLKSNYFYFVILLSFFISPELSAVVVNRIIKTIAVGDSPSAITITPNGRFAYVANDNNDGLVNGDTISVIDLETNTVIKTISDPSFTPALGFNQPYTVTINASGSKVYITNSNSTTITIIDTATNTITGYITGFDGPSGMVITPDGNRAYVNEYGSPAGVGSGNGTTVRVVDLTTNLIVGPAITVGLAPAALDITPNGSYVYVINYTTGNTGAGTISIIDTSTNTVVGPTITGLSGPYAIQITSDGRYAYVTNFGSNNFSPVGQTVSVIDLQKNSIVDTITVGTQPSGIAFSPSGRFAYVTNYNTLYLGAGFTNLTPGQGTVSIIDTCTNTVLCTQLLTGSSPAAIAISQDGQYAYVTNYSSNNVNVIDIYDKMWLNICK
ncbi:MAG: YncE family protein [Candidatus Dependentiae bacterium]|nr:YncE family protein [Candidatus Dependentiae bacterium]